MPGYYPMMSREPVAMAQVYPPARSYSLAKLNQPQPRDYGLYEKVRVDRSAVPHGVGGDKRSHRMFEGLRRQQSYDGGVVHSRNMHHSQPRRLDGFDSLQLLGAHNDDRYLDKFMDSSRTRPSNRDFVEHSHSKSNSKNTLLSTKSSHSKSNSSKNKENNNGSSSLNVSSEILALLGSLANSASVDNIYESVEQIHYRKTLESMNRKEKVRSIHRTGHPLFDHLREERALASDSPNNNSIYSTNTLNGSKQRVSRSAGPSRKTSGANSPTGMGSSNNSSGDEQDIVRRNRKISAPTGPISHSFAQQQQLQQKQQHQQQRKISSTTLPHSWRRGGSAGSESDEEWVIPRPKIGGRRRETRNLSTDESDSSTKSGPLR